MIEEEVYIGVFSCRVSCGRAEQIEMLYPKALQLSPVFSQLRDSDRAFHTSSISLNEMFNRIERLQFRGSERYLTDYSSPRFSLLHFLVGGGAPHSS